MQPIIELKDVWKTYQLGQVKIHALRGLNLEIKKGEFVAVCGPSGSGKSTAMSLIGCLDLPTEGQIFLENQDISKLHESELAQIRGKKIGFVFQQFNLLPTLTALENVQLPMTFQGIEEKERIQRAKYLLELVKLGERINHKPNQLSGGESQRVAIARALSNNPEIILADEPTGNLDSKTGQEIINFIDNLHKKEKRTIVVVTHDKNIAKNAERVIYLKDGQSIKDGRVYG